MIDVDLVKLICGACIIALGIYALVIGANGAMAALIRLMLVAAGVGAAVKRARRSNP